MATTSCNSMAPDAVELEGSLHSRVPNEQVTAPGRLGRERSSRRKVDATSDDAGAGAADPIGPTHQFANYNHRQRECARVPRARLLGRRLDRHGQHDRLGRVPAAGVAGAVSRPQPGRLARVGGRRRAARAGLRAARAAATRPPAGRTPTRGRRSATSRLPRRVGLLDLGRRHARGAGGGVRRLPRSVRPGARAHAGVAAALAVGDGLAAHRASTSRGVGAAGRVQIVTTALKLLPLVVVGRRRPVRPSSRRTSACPTPTARADRSAADGRRRR